MTCEDCIHYDACADTDNFFQKLLSETVIISKTRHDSSNCRVNLALKYIAFCI